MGGFIVVYPLAFLGVVVQFGWMFGRKEGCRWRLAVGGLLLVATIVSLAVGMVFGISNRTGSVGLMASLALVPALYIVPLAEQLLRRLK